MNTVMIHRNCDEPPLNKNGQQLYVPMALSHKRQPITMMFERTNNYPRTVDELTELEAKDLVCDLLVCIRELESKTNIQGLLRKHNLA